jgi:hypothetical protein
VKAWEIEPGDRIVFFDGSSELVKWIDDRIDDAVFHCETRAKRYKYEDEVKVLK